MMHCNKRRAAAQKACVVTRRDLKASSGHLARFNLAAPGSPLSGSNIVAFDVCGCSASQLARR